MGHAVETRAYVVATKKNCAIHSFAVTPEIKADDGADRRQEPDIDSRKVAAVVVASRAIFSSHSRMRPVPRIAAIAPAIVEVVRMERY